MAEQCPLGELEKILVATDGSEASGGAVREAVSLAGRCSSKLTAVSVVETFQRFAYLAPNVIGEMANIAQDQEKDARAHLEKALTDAAATGIKTEIVVKTGDPFGIIIDEAKQTGSELIIIGRRGLSHLERMAMGSVTAKVIGDMPSDVLVVPRDAGTGCQVILAATDGSSDGKTAVEEALKMCHKCDSRLLVISVAKSKAREAEAAEALAQARDLARDGGVEIETISATGKPYVEIIKAARENGVDLIVVGRHGRGKLDRLLMGSVTERVVGHSDCAVLIARTF